MRKNKYADALEILRKSQKYEWQKPKIEAFNKYLKIMSKYEKGIFNEDDLVHEMKSLYYSFQDGDEG